MCVATEAVAAHHSESPSREDCARINRRPKRRASSEYAPGPSNASAAASNDRGDDKAGTAQPQVRGCSQFQSDSQYRGERCKCSDAQTHAQRNEADEEPIRAVFAAGAGHHSRPGDRYPQQQQPDAGPTSREHREQSLHAKEVARSGNPRIPTKA